MPSYSHMCVSENGAIPWYGYTSNRMFVKEKCHNNDDKPWKIGVIPPYSPYFQNFSDNPRGFLAVQWPDSASPFVTPPPKWPPPVNAVRSGAQQNWRARESRPLGRVSWGGREPGKKRIQKAGPKLYWLNMSETPGTANSNEKHQTYASCCKAPVVKLHVSRKLSGSHFLTPRASGMG